MMNKKVLTLDDEPIASIYYTMKECNKKMGTIIREHRPLMDGNRYLTDKEVSQIMKVSRRTLQEYRNAMTLPYIHLGGKVLYREQDIQNFWRTITRNRLTIILPKTKDGQSQMRDCPSFVGCYSATITTVRNMYVELPFRCFLLIHLTYNPLAEDVGVIGIQSERNGNYHFQ